MPSSTSTSSSTRRRTLSPLELAVVLGTVSRGQSVTLSGDVAQRLYMNNGFSSWKGVLSELGLSHVEIEPLRISYRSTLPIIEFSREVLGPLADADAPKATRGGAPVELFRFSHGGDAVGFLGEWLRQLTQEEPLLPLPSSPATPSKRISIFDGLEKRKRRIFAASPIKTFLSGPASTSPTSDK